jgi:hypothetical protein
MRHLRTSLGRDQTAGFDAKAALPGTRRLRYGMGMCRLFLARSLLVLTAQAAQADERNLSTRFIVKMSRVACFVS